MSGWHTYWHDKETGRLLNKHVAGIIQVRNWDEDAIISLSQGHTTLN